MRMLFKLTYNMHQNENTGTEEPLKFLTYKFWFQVNLQAHCRSLYCRSELTENRTSRLHSLWQLEYHSRSNSMMSSFIIATRFTSWQAIPASVQWQAAKRKRMEVSHSLMEVNWMIRIIGRAVNTMNSKKSIQHLMYVLPTKNQLQYIDVTSC